MTQYQEHIQDSQFIDTWQAAEAAQFLKDEAYAAECVEDYLPSPIFKPFDVLAEVPAMTEAELAMNECPF